MWVYLTVLLIGGANLAVSAWWGWQKAMAPDGIDPTGGWAAASTGAAPLVTLFYVTALILLTKFGFRVIIQVLVPVGRMAFTNYLSQTLIMVTLYYAAWGPLCLCQTSRTTSRTASLAPRVQARWTRSA